MYYAYQPACIEMGYSVEEHILYTPVCLAFVEEEKFANLIGLRNKKHFVKTLLLGHNS